MFYTAKGKKELTNNFGSPVDNDQNSMTAGNPGPVLMQDIHLLEKLAQGSQEERVRANNN